MALAERGQSSFSGAPGPLAGAGVGGSWAWQWPTAPWASPRAVSQARSPALQVAGIGLCSLGLWEARLPHGPAAPARWVEGQWDVTVHHELAQRKPPAVWSGWSVNGIVWGSGEPAPYTSFHGALFITKKARGKRWVHCLLPGGVGVLLSCDMGPDHRPPQPVSFPELCGWVTAWTIWRQQWERGAGLGPRGGGWGVVCWAVQSQPVTSCPTRSSVHPSSPRSRRRRTPGILTRSSRPR